MKQIKILCSGCACGRKAAAQIEQIIKNLKIEAQVTTEDDIMEQVKYGVISFPAIVVDGKLVHSGGIPDEQNIREWLK